MFQSKVCTNTPIIFPPNKRKKNTQTTERIHSHIQHTTLTNTLYKERKKICMMTLATRRQVCFHT